MHLNVVRLITLYSYPWRRNTLQTNRQPCCCCRWSTWPNWSHICIQLVKRHRDFPSIFIKNSDKSLMSTLKKMLMKDQLHEPTWFFSFPYTTERTKSCNAHSITRHPVYGLVPVMEDGAFTRRKLVTEVIIYSIIAVNIMQRKGAYVAFNCYVTIIISFAKNDVRIGLSTFQERQ